MPKVVVDRRLATKRWFVWWCEWRWWERFQIPKFSNFKKVKPPLLAHSFSLSRLFEAQPLGNSKCTRSRSADCFDFVFFRVLKSTSTIDLTRNVKWVNENDEDDFICNLNSVWTYQVVLPRWVHAYATRQVATTWQQRWLFNYRAIISRFSAVSFDFFFRICGWCFLPHGPRFECLCGCVEDELRGVGDATFSWCDLWSI